ncbi:MAG: hypothetical protein D6788_10655 [Planctomycetota bacterium]|nr:MAG: hypothetical protein D6788_10655 [Planctomycetota bacterium]
MHVIIDGNNLLFAIRDHAAGSLPGRETLVRIVERWAEGATSRVTLVFDGAAPPPSMQAQMESTGVEVRFSGTETADDVIVRLVEEAPDPGRVRVISSDHAVGHAARYRRCKHATCKTFLAELFRSARRAEDDPAATARQDSAKETAGDAPPGEWLARFKIDPRELDPGGEYGQELL